MRRIGLRVGMSLTLFYILIPFFRDDVFAFLLRIPAFHGSDVFVFLKEGELNEIGAFLAGFFAPLALGWLVAGYFLQRRELRLHRGELEMTRYTLRKQVKLLEEQLRRDR